MDIHIGKTGKKVFFGTNPKRAPVYTSTVFFSFFRFLVAKLVLSWPISPGAGRAGPAPSSLPARSEKGGGGEGTGLDLVAARPVGARGRGRGRQTTFLRKKDFCENMRKKIKVFSNTRPSFHLENHKIKK